MPSPAVSCILMLASYLLAISDDDDEHELALSLLSLGQLLLTRGARAQRRWRGEYRKAGRHERCDAIMHEETNKVFKGWFRVNRRTFRHILRLIEADTVFQSTGPKPQMPVRYQLAAFLGRFGDETTVKLGSMLGMSEGSIYNCCRRVTRALRRIRKNHLTWPNATERLSIKAKMQDVGFPGAVGVVDGSLIPLQTKPLKDPWSYWSRKGNYALAMQAIVDFQGRFRSFDLGWPGSTNDTTMWKMSDFWRNRHLYLSPDEWIMADKGYPITTYAIRPFSEHDSTNDARTARVRTQWNEAFSTQRVVVEHAFGQLKARFPSLRAMPGSRLDHIYRGIEALLVIHNICVDFRDVWRLRQVSMGAEDNSEGELVRQVPQPEREDTQSSRAGGLIRRKQLVEYWDTHIA